MDGVRALAARVQRGLRPRPLPPPARPGRAAAEPDRRRGRSAGARLQHRRQLRHQHELAELRRRVDHGPPHPDGRAHRAELRLGRGRHRRRRRPDPRPHPAPLGDDRELLGRPDADHHPDPAAARDRDRAAAGQPGRRPDASRKRHGDDRRGRDAGDLPRAGREPGGDQGARDERRRDRERELGAPVREPDGVHEPRAAVRDPADPVRADLRVRADGRRPAPGLGDLRRDVRPLGGLGLRRHRLRARRQPTDRGVRREHGGQGGPLRRGGVRPLRGHDHRRPRPAP